MVIQENFILNNTVTDVTVTTFETTKGKWERHTSHKTALFAINPVWSVLDPGLYLKDIIADANRGALNGRPPTSDNGPHMNKETLSAIERWIGK